MAVEGYFDKLFSTACGWLGWVPETVLTTTISQLEMAIEGKIDFVKKTNPFGSEEKEEDKILAQPSDPELAMRNLVNMARRRKASDVRNKSKPKVKK